MVLAGAGLAVGMFRTGTALAEEPAGPVVTAARRNLYGDAVNETVFETPGLWLTRALVYLDGKGIDGLVNGLAATVGGGSGRLRRAQTGFVRSYALSMLGGALLMVVAGFMLWRGKLFTTPWVLWPLLLSFPLPYIANTAGWMTAEIGRQPWLVYGLIRTDQGYSKYVSAGNGLFTLLGFMGMYSMLSILFIVLVYRIIASGPEKAPPSLVAEPITVA